MDLRSERCTHVQRLTLDLSRPVKLVAEADGMTLSNKH